MCFVRPPLFLKFFLQKCSSTPAEIWNEETIAWPKKRPVSPVQFLKLSSASVPPVALFLPYGAPMPLFAAFHAAVHSPEHGDVPPETCSRKKKNIFVGIIPLPRCSFPAVAFFLEGSERLPREVPAILQCTRSSHANPEWEQDVGVQALGYEQACSALDREGRGVPEVAEGVEGAAGGLAWSLMGVG